MGTHVRTMVILQLIATFLALTLGASATGAQTGPDAGFIRTESRIIGDGPWTAWLGGEAHRTLILTIENTGPEALRDPELNLRFGAGRPETLIASPQLDDLAPGERITFELDVVLPRFAVGTHAVEGTLLGADAPVRFRAETTHVPWLLLLLPSFVLVQIALVWLRNLIRRRLTRNDAELPRRASQPDEDHPNTNPVNPVDDETRPTVVDVIERELDTALRDLEPLRLDDDRFIVAVEGRAREVTQSVSDHFAIPASARPRLAAEITRALLDRATSPRGVPA